MIYASKGYDANVIPRVLCKMWKITSSDTSDKIETKKGKIACSFIPYYEYNKINFFIFYLMYENYFIQAHTHIYYIKK